MEKYAKSQKNALSDGKHVNLVAYNLTIFRCHVCDTDFFYRLIFSMCVKIFSVQREYQ